MILRLLAMLRLIELVWLEDHQKNIYLTIKKRHPFGGYWCHVYPWSKIGSVQLKDDGTCYGESYYIKRWTPYKTRRQSKAPRI